MPAEQPAQCVGQAVGAQHPAAGLGQLGVGARDLREPDLVHPLGGQIERGETAYGPRVQLGATGQRTETGPVIRTRPGQHLVLEQPAQPDEGGQHLLGHDRSQLGRQESRSRSDQFA